MTRRIGPYVPCWRCKGLGWLDRWPHMPEPEECPTCEGRGHEVGGCLHGDDEECDLPHPGGEQHDGEGRTLGALSRLSLAAPANPPTRQPERVNPQ